MLMKFFVFILLFNILNSCRAKHVLQVEENEIVSSTECPADGTCTIELMPNKTIKMLYDSFGALYTEIINGNAMTLKFEYKRNDIPNTMDGQYVEQILMELDPNSLEMELKDSELKNVNLLFARFCYCKGQTGYYIVQHGNLVIKKEEENKYHLQLAFKVDEVPQIITEIDQVLSLN